MNRRQKKPLMAHRELREARLELCHECKHYQKALKRCALCGCIVPAKVFVLRSKCPDGRW